jgi:hypothetical protein
MEVEEWPAPKASYLESKRREKMGYNGSEDVGAKEKNRVSVERRKL